MRLQRFFKDYKSQMLSRFSTFKKDSMKTVNYLVKEFEMKKSTCIQKATLLKQVLSAL